MIIIIYFEIDFPYERSEITYNTLLPLAIDENNQFGGNDYIAYTIKSISRLSRLIHLLYYQSNTLCFYLFSKSAWKPRSFRLPRF